MSENDRYCIKSGYVSREAAQYFEDIAADTSGIVHQPDVYALAGYLGRKFGCTHILDIGCGRGKKLAGLHPEFAIVGVDHGTNIAFCRKQYSFGKWVERDLEKPQVDLLPPTVMARTLVICSDVIEHLSEPFALLQTLDCCLEHAPAAVLTTPERDLVRGPDDHGPPANVAHVREWNRTEFAKLLDRHHFRKVFLGLTCNNSRDLEKKTILSILHGRMMPTPAVCNDSAFRVVAIMTAYNEEDIIFPSVRRLAEAGIGVYLIDNWSTDRTVASVEPLLGKELIGMERFPPEGSSDTYDWHRLLTRVEQLASTLRADWFIHHDVDEIREPPWSWLSLRDAIWYADRLGFNAIDHTVIDFRPVDNMYVHGSDFGEYFKYWEFGKRKGHFQQVKAWKNVGQPIKLAPSGGHEVAFEGRKIFPYKFLLRHYPVRSQMHGEKKVLSERRARFNEHERNQLGWHTQYNHIEMGHDFLRSQEELQFFDNERFDQEYLVERISGIGIVREPILNPASTQTSKLLSMIKSLFGRA